MPQALVTCAAEPPSKVAIFSDDAELSWENAIFWRVSSGDGALFGLLGGQTGRVPPDIYF